MSKAVDGFAAVGLADARKALKAFLDSLPAAASHAQQASLLRQLASSSTAVSDEHAAAVFGVSERAFTQLNLNASPAHPFNINRGTGEVRAASVFARQAMLAQADAWDEEERQRKLWWWQRGG
jgi:hypothetical protein